MKLYSIAGSPFGWRVQLALELKRVPYDLRLLSASKGETQDESFRSLNPRAKVPVLQDGDQLVRESLAILNYLDAVIPKPSLFGTTPPHVAHVWEHVCQWTNYAEEPGIRIARAVFTDTVARTPTLSSDVVAAQRELARIEEELIGRNWLATDEVSAADFVAFSGLQVLLRAAGKEAAAPLQMDMLPFEEKYPAVRDWMSRVESLPGYDNTYPPHWRT